MSTAFFLLEVGRGLLYAFFPLVKYLPSSSDMALTVTGVCYLGGEVTSPPALSYAVSKSVFPLSSKVYISYCNSLADVFVESGILGLSLELSRTVRSIYASSPPSSTSIRSYLFRYSGIFLFPCVINPYQYWSGPPSPLLPYASR